MPSVPALARVETYLEEFGALIPTAVLADLTKLLAEQMRRRGHFDAANYMERAARAMEE